MEPRYWWLIAGLTSMFLALILDIWQLGMIGVATLPAFNECRIGDLQDALHAKGETDGK